MKKLIYFVIQTDVQQFIWHTSQATLTQYVRQAYGKTQALKGVMKTMTNIEEHTGDQTVYATRQIRRTSVRITVQMTAYLGVLGRVV